LDVKFHFMQSKLPEVGTTIFTTMSALANKHNAINLSQGFPDFSIDEQLKNDVIEGLKNNEIQYAPMTGRQDLREAIAHKIFMQHNISLNPNTEITITAGATQAIFSVIAALINPGDEVILFDPAYDCYAPSVKLFGGKPIHLKLDYPHFTINWDEVQKKVNKKTKLMITNNPHNPTGAVWSSDDLSELEKVISTHPQLYLLSDEVYEHLNFLGEHQSILKRENLRKKSFAVYSFGKTFHATGWKIGYCVAPENLTTELRKVHQFNVFSVNTTIQYALAKYLNDADNWQSVNKLYETKKSLFLDAMKSSRFLPIPCNGTYFCLFDYSSISSERDVEFSKRLTTEHKVASIPISVFYQDNTDNKILRFCFAKKDETLLNAAERLCKI